MPHYANALQTGDNHMLHLHDSMPSEAKIVSIIENLRAHEKDFTTPRARMCFLNKLYKYQKMLQATRDGQPELWREYSAAEQHAMHG
jgi:hypothetical protein